MLNPFERGGSFGEYIRIIYSFLQKKEWFSYENILERNRKLSGQCGWTKECRDYGEAKKAFLVIKRYLYEKYPSSIETKGNNRNKQFRYVGVDDDPLKEMRESATIRNLRIYAEFCQDSAGLIPLPWLQHFFKNTQDLLRIRTKNREGKQIVEADVNRQLANIELLPQLYEAIKAKKVLRIYYKEFDYEAKSVIIHPHFLKEYNGRWHLYGKTEDIPSELNDTIAHIALDRIQPQNNTWFEYVENESYIDAPKMYYIDRFYNLVGLTHATSKQVTRVHIRTLSNYMYGLVKTKNIHHTQIEIIEPGSHDDGWYAEFTVDVELNNEFIGRILQMGDGLEIVAPLEARKMIKEKVKKMAKLYSE